MEPHDPLASLCIDSSGNAPSRRGAMRVPSQGHRGFRPPASEATALTPFATPVTRSSILLNIKYSRDSRREFSR